MQPDYIEPDKLISRHFEDFVDVLVIDIKKQDDGDFFANARFPTGDISNSYKNNSDLSVANMIIDRFREKADDLELPNRSVQFKYVRNEHGGGKLTLRLINWKP